MRHPYELHREQWVPRPVPEIFAFFSDARNLELLTPPWLQFQVRTHGPIELGRGAKIEYRLGWHGIPIQWVTEITRWEPPHEFEDDQLSGPYRLWRHVHRFEEADGGARMIDTVRYALPFGFVGRMMHALSVKRNLDAIFDYRKEKIAALFS